MGLLAFLKTLSVVSKVVSHFSPAVKRIGKLKNVSKATLPVASPETAKALDDALDLLRTTPTAEPWWARARQHMEGLIVRPELFQQPATQEWLNQGEVAQALKDFVANQHFGRAQSPEAYEFLTTSYMDATYDGRAQAESAVLHASAFLRVSLEAGMSDPRLAEMVRDVRKGQAVVESKLTSIATTLDQRDAKSDPLVTESAKGELARVLRRRFAKGQNVGTELKTLWTQFRPGERHALASKETKAQVAYWLARVEGAAGNAAEMQRWMAELERLGQESSQALHALRELASGREDDALRVIREIDSAEGRALLLYILCKAKGEKAAGQHFSEFPLQSELLTPHGWRQYLAHLLHNSEYERAYDVLRCIPEKAYEDCTDLHLLVAITLVTQILPVEVRAQVVRMGWVPLTNGILDGPSARGALRNALDHLHQCRELALKDQAPELARDCDRWTTALKLVDPELCKDEVRRLQSVLQDGREAVHLAQFAFRFRVPFDASGLESHLARQALLGGLTDDELLAKLELLRATHRAEELVAFLDDHFDRLRQFIVPGGVVIELINALCTTKNTDRASRLLREYEKELGADAARAQMMIDHAGGQDPSSRAVAIFRETNSLGDLSNVVTTLEAQGKWRDLVPYALEQFERSPNATTARFYAVTLERSQASAGAVVQFLQDASLRVHLTDELLSLKAWAHYNAGEHLDAKRENDKLLSKRTTETDFALDMNLAVACGEWERFSELLVRAKSQKDFLSARALLVVAHVAGMSNPAQAFELAADAVGKQPDDPQVLVAAYGIGVATGRESEASEWMRKAVMLSKPDAGPVRAYTFRELIEFMRAQGEARAEKNEKFRKAEVPIHFAATLFNTSVAELLLNLPRNNRAQSDWREKRPLPLWSGSRAVSAVGPEKHLALDATSIYLLQDHGLLHTVLDHFPAISVSPSFFDFLVNERQRVVFHQPSRIDAAKPLISLVQKDRLRRTRGASNPSLSEEVGQEVAELIAAADRDQGWFVCSRPIYRVSSYMEEIAELGKFKGVVIDVPELAEWLVRRSAITRQVADDVRAKIAPSSVKVSFFEPQCLFLDGTVVQSLADLGLLIPTVNVGIPVYVHDGLVREWEELTAIEPKTAETAKTLDDIRKQLRGLLSADRLRFLPRMGSASKGRRELTETGLLDLVGAAKAADVVVIDDRMISSMANIGPTESEPVPLCTTLDGIEELVRAARISAEEKRQLYHRFREACIYCVPLEAVELERMLRSVVIDEDELRESAELRVLRQYVARLMSADVLCIQTDLAYLDVLWRVASQAIQNLWMDSGLPLDHTKAMCSWVVRNLIPAPELALKHSTFPREQKLAVATERAFLPLLSGFRYGPRLLAYMEWYEQHWLDDLPGGREVHAELVKRTRQFFLQRGVEGK